ncbi:uncharacterized protein LOC9304839 [Arabidopsis lyrata subsp. lyrata]|uniref:uncharacterized protein LOC9304839 n=1 Tax=Arabidopsis lyrata subsp. lyrata TaxID=81972 RepID=UPI000A29CD9D|nr:uncharacterized protein LOC9304839 [Arabidopsis lyrata subsp. lyrata]|eukprot:XP_002868767.2 uncharacterized protein LOC9304839 [Arabidopsis lyrata subsp. lyrata]
MAPKGKSSRGRGGGATTRRGAAGGGQTSRQEATGGGQTSRQEAAGGGVTTRRVAAGGGQALPQQAVGGGETSRPVRPGGRVRTFVGHRPPVTASGVGTSSNASNPPSASQSATQSQVSRPSLNSSRQNPPPRQTPPLNRQTPPPQPQHQPPSPQTQPLPEHDANNQVLPENEDLVEEEIDDVGQEDDKENPNPGEDYQEMLDRLLALPGREHLPRLSCTHIDDQGNPYGLGSLVETLHKGKRKESYASYSSTVTVVELQEQLRRKISDQDAENARRDEEHRKSQARIASLEKLILFMKDKDPDLAAFMSTSPLLEPEVIIPPTTTTNTLPATTGAAVQPAGHTTGTTPTSPLSTASNEET